MAQAGYTPISLYYSTTVSTAPTSGNLVNGELAINITDGKLYYKDNGGTVQIIASKAGASGDVVGPASATDNAIVRFDGATGKLVQNSVVTIADSTGDISGVGTLNATTLDATNIEVTNIKAKDGTAAGSIADSTGVVTLGSSVLTTTDINGGTIDNTAIGGSTAAAGSFTTLTTSSTVTLNGGTANGVLYLNGSKVATSGSALTFDGNYLTAKGVATSGTATTAALFTGGVTSTAGSGAIVYLSDGGTARSTYISGFSLDGTTNAHALSFGVSAAYAAPSEGMRLTSTGLGIGTSSPKTKLDVSGNVLVGPYNTSTNYATLSIKTASTITTPSTFTNAINIWNGTSVGEYSNITFGYNTLGLTNASAYIGFVSTSSANSGKGDLVFGTRDVTTDTAATERMRLDSSGNLGLGVTPSAWNAGAKAAQVGSTTALWNFSNGLYLSNNRFFDTGGTNKYIITAAASAYEQSGGSHVWLTAPSGTAGNTISFTQAMTLDASGNLGLGTTSPTGISGYTAMKINNASSGAIIDLAQGDTMRGRLVAVTGSFTLETSGSIPILFYPGGTERARITSGGNFKIGGTADRGTTEGDKQLVLFNGTAPVGTLANGISLYSSSGEAYVMDAAGNATLFSPHDRDTNEWIFRSKHTPSGKVLKIDVERLLRFVNDHFGLDAVQEFIEP